jgi:hypothetical protein
MAMMYAFDGLLKNCFTNYQDVEQSGIPEELLRRLREENHIPPAGKTGIVLHWVRHIRERRTLGVFSDGHLCVVAMAGLTPHLKRGDEVLLRPYREDVPATLADEQEHRIAEIGRGPHYVADRFLDIISLKGLPGNFGLRQLYQEATPYTPIPQEESPQPQSGILSQIPYREEEIRRPTDGFRPGMRVSHREFPLSGTVVSCRWHHVEVKTSSGTTLFEPKFLVREEE